MQRKEEVRENVRQTYGDIAVQGSSAGYAGITQSCCGRSESETQSKIPACGCGW